MASKNKDRGTNAENYVAKRFNDAGLKAKRTWGSDGRSIGLSEGVDVVMKMPGAKTWTHHFQVKKRQTVASYFYKPEGTHAVIVKQDYKEPLVVLELKDYIQLMLRLAKTTS